MSHTDAVCFRSAQLDLIVITILSGQPVSPLGELQMLEDVDFFDDHLNDNGETASLHLEDDICSLVPSASRPDSSSTKSTDNHKLGAEREPTTSSGHDHGLCSQGA